MVTIGIDAHKSSLAVALVDELGRELAAREFGNQPRAYRALYAWVLRLAPDERRFGVESTGWVGRGIACFLLEHGETVVDVRGSLTERQRKRLRGRKERSAGRARDRAGDRPATSCRLSASTRARET
jgi:hypothetical protein